MKHTGVENLQPFDSYFIRLTWGDRSDNIMLLCICKDIMGDSVKSNDLCSAVCWVTTNTTEMSKMKSSHVSNTTLLVDVWCDNNLVHFYFFNNNKKLQNNTSFGDRKVQKLNFRRRLRCKRLLPEVRTRRPNSGAVAKQCRPPQWAAPQTSVSSCSEIFHYRKTQVSRCPWDTLTVCRVLKLKWKTKMKRIGETPAICGPEIYFLRWRASFFVLMASIDFLHLQRG